MTTLEAWLIGGLAGVGFIAVRAALRKVLIVRVRPRLWGAVKRPIGIVMLLLIGLAFFIDPPEWERDSFICFGVFGYLLLAWHLIFIRPKQTPALDAEENKP